MTSGRLAVTNLAWPKGEDGTGMRLLQRLGAAAVEIAPAHSLGTWDATVMQRAARLRDAAAARGLRIAALQGWLFGVEGVSLFGPAAERAALARHLERVAEMAECLGAAACVWGAPRSRDPHELSAAQAFEAAARFLRMVGPAFAARGTVLAFEANASVYGCRFVTHTADAVALVRAADAAGIGVQLDTGTMLLNAEPLSVIATSAPWIAHVHVSEPALAPIGSSSADHAALAGALRGAGWSGWISLEMKATPDWQQDLTTAFATAAATYGAP